MKKPTDGRNPDTLRWSVPSPFFIRVLYPWERKGWNHSAPGDSPVPAGDVDGFAGDPAGLGGRQEDGDRADIVRLADPAQRRRRYDLLLEVAADEPRRVHAFGLDHA